MVRKSRVEALERQVGDAERPTEYLDLTGFTTGKISLLDKVRLLREARERVGPDGHVQVMAFVDDPIWDQVPRIERETRVMMHWTDDM